MDDFVQQMKSSGDYDGGGPIDDAYEAIWDLKEFPSQVKKCVAVGRGAKTAFFLYYTTMNLLYIREILESFIFNNTSFSEHEQCYVGD